MKKWIYATVASVALAMSVSAMQPTDAPTEDEPCCCCCCPGPCC